MSGKSIWLVSAATALVLSACTPVVENTDAESDTATAVEAASAEPVSASEGVTSEASAAFNQLVADYEAHQEANSNARRGQEGDLEALASWDDISADAQAADNAADVAFLERLEAIDASQLTQSEQVSHAVLDYILRFSVELHHEQKRHDDYPPFHYLSFRIMVVHALLP